jgi:drug/metabolite transporter (DMT)-like permease
MTFDLCLALAAGVAFSLIAIAYRSNAALGFPPAFAALGMGVAGTLWFGFRSFWGEHAPGPEAPALVWAVGMVCGAAQGMLVFLYRIGLRRGPLAPLWCAGNLAFVTPAIYSLTVLGDRLNPLQAAGMGAAFLCVAVSSLGHGEEPGSTGPQRATPVQRLLYGCVLLAMVLLTGLVGAGLRHMAVTKSGGVPLNPLYNDCFLMGLYAALMICAIVETWRHGYPRANAGRVTRNGLIAGTGSVVGMVLTAVVSDMPGAIGFAAISVSSVLAGALITSFGFHERRGPAWYATLALAVAAVLLFNLPQ